MAFAAGEGAGKSGSFFFATYDSKYLIKTMKSSEKKAFLDILDNYVLHLRRNPDSLITRIYGIFTIKSN